jgi:hypothetical protein
MNISYAVVYSFNSSEIPPQNTPPPLCTIKRGLRPLPETVKGENTSRYLQNVTRPFLGRGSNWSRRHGDAQLCGYSITINRGRGVIGRIIQKCVTSGKSENGLCESLTNDVAQRCRCAINYSKLNQVFHYKFYICSTNPAHSSSSTHPECF